MASNQLFQYRHRLRPVVISLVCVGLLGSTLPSEAAFTTAITPDGTLGTSVTQSGNIFNINGGTIKGNNQFHSLSLLNVGTGDIASFNGPANIANILTRVTGGQSMIDGQLRSTITGANLYLMNPAGVIFGPNATLNVSGSFHVSTADYIRLTDGVRFTAVPGAQDALLSTAPVAAFGFVGPNPAPITIQGSSLAVADGKTISVVGGNLTIQSGILEDSTTQPSTLSAPNGRIQLVSVGSAGEVQLINSDGTPNLKLVGFTSMGPVDLSDPPVLDSPIVLIRGSVIGSVLDGHIVLDGSLGPRGALFGPDFLIPAEVGQIRGGNLFQSFSRFDLYANESATFQAPLDPSLVISNILARVTGGEQSFLDGTLRSGIPGAHLYFLNPAGVVFGGGATLDVSGSFHVSTADYLRFSDNVLFSAGLNPPQFDPVNPPVLTSNQPVAFGFTGPDVGPIDILTSALNVPLGQTLSVIGGDITIAGGSLAAPSGQINLVSVASAGEVLFPTLEYAPNINGTSFTSLGTISLSQGALVDVSDYAFAGDAHGGTVVIRGGRLMMDNSSIFSNTLADAPGADLAVDIQVTQDVVLTNGAQVFTSTGLFGSGVGKAGDINVAADSVVISGQNDFFVASGLNSTTQADGAGGKVTLTAQSLSMDNGGVIVSQAGGLGQGGEIVVNVQRATLAGGALISSNTQSGGATLPSGKVTVTATDSISLSGNSTGIFTQSFGNAPGGDISVHGGKITLADHATIHSGEDFGEQGGSIEIVGTDSVSLSSGSRIFNQAFSAPASPVHITTPVLVVDNASINTGTLNTGRGGDIILEVGNANLTNGALISSKSTSLTNDAGNAGDIHITADRFLMRDSTMTTQAVVADGGNITIRAGEVVQLINSSITTSVGTGAGSGGNITIDPQFVILQNSQILANAFEGPGGNITIVAGFILITPGSVIDASSALGVSGIITLDSAITDLSGSLAPLPQGFLRKGILLSSRCAARVGGSNSSFVVAGREAIPMEPGGLLPSPLPESGGLSIAESGSGLLSTIGLSATLEAGLEQGCGS